MLPFRSIQLWSILTKVGVLILVYKKTTHRCYDNSHYDSKVRLQEWYTRVGASGIRRRKTFWTMSFIDQTQLSFPSKPKTFFPSKNALVQLCHFRTVSTYQRLPGSLLDGTQSSGHLNLKRSEHNRVHAGWQITHRSENGILPWVSDGPFQ